MPIYFGNSADFQGNPVLNIVDDASPSSAVTANKLQVEKTALTGAINTVDDRVDAVETSLSNAIATLEAQITAAVNERDFKDSCNVAATANINLSLGAALVGTTIQGVVLADGLRVLLTAQTDATQNGIYSVVTGTGLVRASDANTDAEITSGMLVGVSGGDLLNQTIWMLMTADPITLGTTELEFSKFRSIHDLTIASETGLELTGSGVLQYADAAQARVTLGVVEEYETTLGNGTDVTYQVAHSLNNDLVAWSVVRIADGEYIQVAPKRVDANTVSFTFGSAPASNALRVTVAAVKKA